MSILGVLSAVSGKAEQVESHLSLFTNTVQSYKRLPGLR